ncbi:uncharacterized protein LOC114360413 [Ostrinia furnacalis]|uniref:uncharacterized protein LOC114360413 n=1 Tax=Ostrinia furnacalis TaxID=93504 RepID=UPI00103C3E4A|nr:uncharacterized protein LOC114360413 [Ostrinia furnacalis]
MQAAINRHDAGGPAILAGKLVGIISFGPSVCGYPNAPTVFTLVGAFSDWIETVNETMPDYYRARARSTTTTRRPIFEYLGTIFNTPPPTEAQGIEIRPLKLITLEATPPTVPTEVTTEYVEEETTEPPGLRFLKDQFSDADSWGDKK